uniref:Reverse transcriptase N-terminal domain-containing protein n=1 Tax=Dipterocladia arabiensis TaxID=2007176 RepID=A0A1Z1M069_9FLOR|nr:hypothetical protein [Dipterocladia arabiensis]ARW59366.1 hypothetical protein [Dipterocladia arabiensis]
MVLYYNLSINTNWKLLPWKDIYTRIIIIQKKIYQASKSYNWQYLCKLQKYLINSNEAKIFSIKYIINQLYIYNKHKKKIKYKIKDKEKFIIFKVLFDVCQSSFFVIEKVKQYLIHLCIKPEWEAKFLFSHYETISINIINNFSIFDKYTNLFTNYLQDKNIVINYIKKKIKALKCLENLLYHNIYIDPQIHNKNIIEKIITNHFYYYNEYNLYLSQCFLININWYKLYLHKLNLLQNSNKFLINTSLTLKIIIEHFNKILTKNNIYYKCLIQNIKFYLHNHSKSIYNLINFKYLYKYTIIILIFLYFIRQIYPIINLIIYYIIKKQYKKICKALYSINVYNLNYNVYFYSKKIEYFYINYFNN